MLPFPSDNVYSPYLTFKLELPDTLKLPTKVLFPGPLCCTFILSIIDVVPTNDEPAAGLQISRLRSQMLEDFESKTLNSDDVKRLVCTLVFMEWFVRTWAKTNVY